MNRFVKTLFFAIMLLAMPLKQWGQTPQVIHNSATISFDITNIAIFDERVFFLYNLTTDGRFEVINSEQDGVFIISASNAFEHLDLEQSFSDFQNQNANDFRTMSKEQAAEMAAGYKENLPNTFVSSLMMDYYIRSRQNNTCANAEPFCTDNGMYEFPAGVNAGSGESGPDYDCLYSTPNPAWYFMRILNPGGMTIHMFSTPGEDIDFCCWGPYSSITDPSPCSNLTSNKVVSCSYSANPTENCIIPSTAQTGDYFILVITNYSNDPCNISFSKTGGTGTTDCGIMPPLVENDGPYCVGETIHLTANGQAGASYSWSGPAGFSSTLQNPTITNCTAAMSGTYTCTITVGSASNSATTEVEVRPQPTANFTATTVCQGNATQFTNTSTTNPSGQSMTYQWSFGDGHSSTEQSPSHTYATPGPYTVTLTVTSGDGHCTDTKTLTVNVNAQPVANAGPDQTIPYNTSTQLSGSGGAGTFDFHWEPENKVTNPNAQNTQTVILTQDQTYTLTVTDPVGGCSSTSQVTIHIEGGALNVSANAAPSSICEGNSTQLTASAGGGSGNSTYSWTPTTGLSNPNIYNPVATPTHTTTYTCTVHNPQTSQTATASVTVTVHHSGASEEEHYICSGDTYEWHGQTCSDATDYYYTTQTQYGCDSIVTLHLHHYPIPTDGFINEAICSGESYDFFGTPIDYPVTDYPYTLQNGHGCDSIVRLNLTVYPPNDIDTIKPGICVGQTYNFHGIEYDQDGQTAFFDTIDNHGCPKVEMLILSVGEYQMPPVENIYRCYGHDEEPSFTWDINNTEYNTDTIVEAIVEDINGGCDFKYRLNLKFHQDYYSDHYSVEEPITTCDEYTLPFPGYPPFTESNHHFVVNLGGGGGANFECDSIYVFDITINKQSVLEDETITEECDSVAVTPWPGHETVFFYENTPPAGYKFTGLTEDSCYLEKTFHIENMKYAPNPYNIKPNAAATSWFALPEDPNVPDTAMCSAVVTNTEFFSFQYTFYVEETNSKCLWDNCTWTISKPSWTLEPTPATISHNGKYYSECKVYVAERDDNYVVLTATITNSCGSKERKLYLKSSFLDIEEYNNAPANVNIVPNPNNGQMHLDFENMEGRTTVKVFDMTGNQIDAFETTINSNRYNYEYHMKRYAEGIYFFVVSNNNRVLTKKVVILH